MNLPQSFPRCEFQLFSVFGLTFFHHVCTEEGIYHVLWSSARMSGWADHVYVCWTVSGMAAWVLNYLSLTFPTFSNLQFNPAFLPCPLQDIYELKDQIQDVEGRYMQGLKELKVEGLELTACLLLFSGTSLASLTLLFLLSLAPPKCLVFVCASLHGSLLLMFWSTLLVVTWNNGTPGYRFVRRFNMLHMPTNNMLLILSVFPSRILISHCLSSFMLSLERTFFIV